MGFIGKSRVQAPLCTARVSILQGFYREKSCPGPFVYSKGDNITGFYKESRDPALYADPEDAVLQGLYCEKLYPGSFVHCNRVNITGVL